MVFTKANSFEELKRFVAKAIRYYRINGLKPYLVKLRNIKPIYYFIGPPGVLLILVILFIILIIPLAAHKSLKNLSEILLSILTFLGLIVLIAWPLSFLLGFYFLATSRKKSKATIQEPPSARLSIQEFIKQFFTQYDHFIRNFLTLKSPPFFGLILWLYGMTLVIDRIELRLIRGLSMPTENWFFLWLLIMFIGPLSGVIGYYLRGSLFHVGVWLSNGLKNIRASRNIYLYSGLPIYLVTILSELFDSIAYGKNYFIEETNFVVDIIWFILILIATGYSIALGYRGVRLLQQTKKIRSIIFFIILPMLAHIIYFSIIVFSVFQGKEPSLETPEFENDGLPIG